MKKNWKELGFVVLLVAVVFASATALFAQRADRGLITGLVTDSSGAAVPKASVRVTDEGTSVETVVETTDAGNYTTPLLILGTYTIKVEKEGFKTYVRPGIILTAGANYRQDVALQLGEVNQTVEVTAASELINVSTPEVSSVVNEKYYQDLPVVMGADIRLAESLLHVQPGYLPMQPNGDTMFRGTQFNSRINGGQVMTVENWFDGAAFGFAEGHQQTQESALPYEAVKEMKVIAGTFSAQYGHSSGGIIEYVTKSGSSQFHGNVYEYFGNDALFARGFFLPSKNTVRQNAYGVSAGGPVFIPKLYNGKGKTFFFTNLDVLEMNQGIEAGYLNTVPVAPFRTGDFSQLLGGQVGKDALGRPIFAGEIFNPATTHDVNGVPVRDGYGFDPVTGQPIPGQANIIPANDPLRSGIAAKIIPLIPQPQRGGLVNNLLGGTGDATHIFHVKTWLLRMDHTFSPNVKSTSTFFLNERPSVRHCGEVQECNVPNDPFTNFEKNTDYIGSGFYQRIYNRFFHQQFDWVLRPNLFNHSTFSYDRWWIGGHALGTSNWNERLGIKGIPYDGGAFPNLNFAGNIPYSHLGRSWGRGANNFDANNRWQFLDDISWIKGRHTIKAGVEYRYHQYPTHGWGREFMGSYSFDRLSTGGYDAQGNNVSSTGDPFASFILGQVFTANFGVPTFSMYIDKYYNNWINDDFKVSEKLTLNFGLRWDYMWPRYERFDRYSTFDPKAPNPGAGNIPGALVFAGTGPGRTGRRTFENSIKDAIGPRFGFAYRLGENTVVRGGYGMYFSNVPFSQFAARPVQGFETNPVAPNFTNGRFPAYYWDNGFPQQYVVFPPQIDPALENNQSIVAVHPDDLRQPRYQNWSVSVQRQLSDNLAVDIAYVGNHGTRLPTQGDFLGTGQNMVDPKWLSLGASVLSSSNFNDPAVVAAGIKIPYAGFPGTVAQALRPFPQYGGVDYRDAPIGNSIYHALEVKLDRRFTNGLQARVAYTWSKLINDGAENAQGHAGPFNASAWQGSGVQNPLNTHGGERGLSADDVPHTLVLAYTWELPFGPNKRFANKKGTAGKVLGGWSFSAIQRYQSGRPINIVMANDLGGFLFNGGKRPNKVTDSSSNLANFDPATDRAFDSAGWADPGPLNFGNASRTDPHVRSFHFFNEDFNIFKDTYVYQERVKMRFEAQFGNAFNRHFFCNPNTFYDTPSFNVFGAVNSQCDVPRRIQFGLRFDW